MTSNQSPRRAVEFKGRMMTLTVLRIGDGDLRKIGDAVAVQLERMPGFFQNMPVMIETELEDLDLAGVADVLRGQGLVPVALYRPSPALEARAQAAGLGVVTGNGGVREPAERPPERERPAPPPASKGYTPTKTLTQPVRSGQQIYARGGDLIVLSSVSPGAELLADGCIHVYGSLRGRALAGAQGDESARIFCHQLDAELIAVAGRYRISEDIDERFKNQAVHISLEGESLIISPLN